MSSVSRIENSIRNSTYGIIIVCINTVISFVTRLLIVNYLGIQALGLNGLFSEVISMLSLAEMGIGMAIVYSLYKPLNDLDYKRINQLMSLFRIAYNKIALLTFILGCLITPFIHYFITEINYPLYYIRIIFILFVINTSVSYLFSYKTSLLNADQKQYVVSVILVIVRLVFTGLIIFLLIVTHNYIVFLIVTIVQSLVANIIISKYVDRKYPHLCFNEQMMKEEKHEIFSNIKNIFIKRVSGVITGSTTNVLISVLVSTIQVGYFSNYLTLFSPFKIFKQQLTNGIAASVGNLSVSSSMDNNMTVLYRLTFIFYIYSIVMSSVLLGISEDFISVWLGSSYLLPSTILVISVFNLYIDCSSAPLWQYLEVSGLFKQDRNIAILGSVLNLCVAIYAGMIWGMPGIFMGAIVSQIIQLILKSRLLFKYKYGSISPMQFYYYNIKMLFGFIVVVICYFYYIKEIYINNLYITLIVKGMLSLLQGLMIPIVLFGRSHEFTYTLLLIKNRLCRRQNL